MTSSPEMWNAINTLGLVLLGVIAIYNTRKLAEVKENVDGPLTLATKSNAELAELVRELRGTPDDIKKAENTKAIAENHEAGKVKL